MRLVGAMNSDKIDATGTIRASRRMESATHCGVSMKNTIGGEVSLNGRGFTRRELLKLAMATAGVFLSTSYFLDLSGWAAGAKSAQEAQSANVDAATVQCDSGGVKIDAYVAKPKGGGKNPAVIVIHDNQGLNDPMREVTRQFAAAGFVAMAPDLASRLGASKPAGQALQAITQLSPNLTVQDLRADRKRAR